MGTIARSVSHYCWFRWSALTIKQGDSGDSCTWVVQRYMKRFGDQSSPFAAKVYFFAKDRISRILRALLAKYFRASGKIAKENFDNDDDEEDEDVKDDAFDDQGSRVESFSDQRDAVLALMAMFCDHPEFESVEAAHEYLKRAKCEDDERILATMMTWAKQLIARELNGDTSLNYEVSTPEELLLRLQPYTHQLGGPDDLGELAPWPLVSAIDFGLEHPLLKEGIVFVDAPGLTDASTSRAANAARQHRECTHLIVVAEIGRAEADGNLRTHLERGYRMRGSGKVILVLTHGDSISPDTDVIGSPMEKKTLARFTQEIKDLRDEKSKKMTKRNSLPLDDRDELDEELRAIGGQIRQKTAEKDSLRIHMRNRKVVKTMQEIYKQLTRDPRPLACFAVGNMVYQQYQAGFTTDEKPQMSVRETGIPALRHHLYQMPVKGRYNDTMHQAEVQLPILATSFELYCTKMHLARKAEIEAMILEPNKILPEAVNNSLDKLKQDVDAKILVPMKTAESDWVKKARTICRRWKIDYISSNMQLLKKNGVRNPTKRQPQGINWDAELLEIGKKSLEECFSELQRGLSAWARDVNFEIDYVTDAAREKIKRTSPSCFIHCVR